MTNVPQDLLLLTIKSDGGWLGGGLGPDEALGVAAAAQLVIDGAVTVRDAHVEDVDPARVPEDLRPHVHENAPLADVVEVLGPMTKERGLARLESAGVIEVTRKKFLGLLPTVTMTVLDPAPRAAVLARVEALVAGRETAEPTTTALLITILDATGLLPFLLTVPPSRREEIVGAVAGDEPLVDEARRSLEQLRVAVYTSVILPTAFGRP